MQGTLSNFLKFKLITIINIVLTIFFSIFIHYNIPFNSEVNSYTHFINFDLDYTIPAEANISEKQIIDVSRANNELQEKLRSYSNFKSWIDFNQLNEDDLDYREFLNLNIDKGKIIVIDKNTNSSDQNPKPINLISDYIMFSINYLNYIYNVKYQKLIDYNVDQYFCNNVENFIKLEELVNESKGNNSNIDKTFSKLRNRLLNVLTECIEKRLYTSEPMLVESLSPYFEKSFKQEFIDINLYKFISILAIKKETQTLNNLNIINIYTLSIILLILSLTFQNMIMIYLERNK